MIGHDTDASAALVTAFRQVAGIDNLSAELREEFDELAGSAWLPNFPGTLLVWPRQNKHSLYYALAANASEWRRLRPLLIAFVGPTLTSFNGFSEPLLPTIPIESFLLSKKFHVVARLVPGDEIRIREMTRRSLVRMLKMIAGAPPIAHAAPQPTSRLLAQFIECLNGNDRSGAEHILEVCRNELRVDALNLLFLRIRLLSHFSDWRGILEMQEFPSLCYTRKPLVVSVTLLEALYQVHLAPFDPGDRLEQHRSYWRDKVRLIARPLLRLPIPKSSGIGALKLYAWEALEAETRRPDLELEVLAYRDVYGELAEELVLAGRTGPSKLEESTNVAKEPLAVVQRTLVEVDDTNTLSSISAALTQLAQLDEEDRKELLGSEPFRSVWQSLYAETRGSVPPIGWSDWLVHLSDPGFTTAFSVLQRAVTEWPASSLIDPTEIAAVAESLAAVSDTPPGSERLADALPLLVAWVAEDPEFPRAGLIPVYEMLLYHLVVGARRASVVYDSAALLIRALLSIGVNQIQYKALLDDCLELVGVGAGTRSVYWLLDIIEETILNPAPSLEYRQGFWFAVHARLIPLRAHFSPGQRITVDRIAASIGWGTVEIGALAIPDNCEQTEHLRVALSDITIAIYSLTESAARQAAQAISVIAPDAKIFLSHDTCGTSALKSMAQNSDIFVVATASAKHAATGFIQQMRPRNKPLLFAAGRGFSSILRAIEDFVLDTK